MAVKSAGIILFRLTSGEPEVLLVHPGGPFFKNKDDGFWSIPKGQADNGEEGEALLEVAKREFLEETGFEAPEPFEFVGEVVRARDKKSVRAWATQGDIDTTAIKSLMVSTEWPPKSGKKTEFPEIDRGAFFTLPEAKKKISSYMLPLLEQFEKVVVQ